MKVIFITVIILIAYFYLTKSLENNKKIDNKLLGFIENAHEAYIKSCEIEDVTPFARYANPDVMVELREKIEYGENELFGVKRYRERSVVLIDERETSVRVKISLSHQHIKINKGMSVAIGDDISSIWRIRIVNNKYKVIEIL